MLLRSDLVPAADAFGDVAAVGCRSRVRAGVNYAALDGTEFPLSKKKSPPTNTQHARGWVERALIPVCPSRKREGNKVYSTLLKLMAEKIMFCR